MNSLALVHDAETPALATDDPQQDPVVDITITELVRIEERLAMQAHLGDLHPSHARHLTAISAELDRRWSTFA